MPRIPYRESATMIHMYILRSMVLLIKVAKIYIAEIVRHFDTYVPRNIGT
jgi:hypothetical protein